MHGGGKLRGYGEFRGAEFMTVGTTQGTPAAWTIIAIFRSRIATRNFLVGARHATTSQLAWGLIDLNQPSANKVSYSFGDGTNLSTGGMTTANAAAFEGKWVTVTLKYPGAANTECAIYVNDGAAEAITTTATPASSTAGAAQNFSVGRYGSSSTTPANADIGMVIVYPSALSDGDRATVRDWAQGLFGL